MGWHINDRNLFLTDPKPEGLRFRCHSGNTLVMTPFCLQTAHSSLYPCVCAHLLSGVWLFATPWTAARRASLSMGFPRQEHWSGLPFASPATSWPKDRSHISCIGRQILLALCPLGSPLHGRKRAKGTNVIYEDSTRMTCSPLMVCNPHPSTPN